VEVGDFALGKGHNPNAKERQSLEEASGVFLVATEAVKRLREDNVEFTVERPAHEGLESWSEQRRPGDCVIVEFVGDRPSFALGEGAADADLVGDRCIALIVRGISGVNCYSHTVSSPGTCATTLPASAWKLSRAACLARRRASARSASLVCRSGVDALLNSKVKLGADVSVAAGPKGRDAEASTDASLRAEIVSYSRSRGLFAGCVARGHVASSRR
jgi:hypothetical protein